jgi:RecB family exonuclease
MSTSVTVTPAEPTASGAVSADPELSFGSTALSDTEVSIGADSSPSYDSLTYDDAGELPQVEPVKPEPIQLSATRLKTYLTCPRQYRYRYVEKLPTTLTGALAFSNVMKQVIHDLHQWSICSNEPPRYDVALSNFARLWEKAVTEEEPAFKEVAEIAGYAHLAEIILRGYVAAHQDKPQPFLLGFPFDLELEDECSGQSYILSGTIDRIDQLEEGLILVDFKTGKRKPSPQELAFDIQATVSAYAAGEVFGQEVVEVQLYHLRDQTVFHTTRGAADTQTLMQLTIPEVIEGITKRRFDAKLGYWCHYCEFREQCMKEGQTAPSHHASNQSM